MRSLVLMNWRILGGRGSSVFSLVSITFLSFQTMIKEHDLPLGNPSVKQSVDVQDSIR